LLDETTYSAAWLQGERLTVEQAIDQALNNTFYDGKPS
jgi:hypothetical protein